MRGLAKFVMTGRGQAVAAAMLLGLVPVLNMLSPAVTGLVMLRRGVREGAFVMMWALLPLAGWAVAGEPFPLIVLAGVAGLAWLLRETRSWALVLLAAVLIGVGWDVYAGLEPAPLDALLRQMETLLAASGVQAPGMRLEDVWGIMLNLLGASLMVTTLLVLVLARWMQAGLYNPGGFGREFHSLRFGWKAALALLAAMLLSAVGMLPGTWIVYLMVPFTFSGVALVHGVVAIKQLSAVWLVAFYALLLTLPVLANRALLLATLLDSGFDFRGRLGSSAGAD